MSSILIFPGQGSQSVGMGKDLYDNHQIARDVFNEVDDALGFKLSDIIFNGPLDELTMTANVQPAIMATSIAMFRVANVPLTEYVAGHSLGEYTALCAAGAISLADTAKLLRLRGESMQTAVPVGQGAMAVIMGLDIDALKDICMTAEKSAGDNFVCDIANDNCPGQVVISGSKPAIEIAMELAKSAGAKRAMLLPLSVPPHSRLMAPVAIQMKDALDKIEIKTPGAALISNKTCAPMTDVNEIKDALVYQITHGVRWRESVIAFSGLGITETIECGPGAVLTGMTPRNAPSMTAKKLEI